MPAKTRHSHRAPPTPEREAGAAGYDDLLQSSTGLAASLQALDQQAVEQYTPIVEGMNGRKSPSWIAFIVAHELGHIHCGHLKPGQTLVDERIETQVEDNHGVPLAVLYV